MTSDKIVKVKNAVLADLERDRQFALEDTKDKCNPKFVNMMYDQKRDGIVALYYKLMDNV